jgi:futalosine hydrolase
VCLALSVPFAEVRAVSNIVGERDRAAWNIPAAIRAVNDAVLAALTSEPR